MDNFIIYRGMHLGVISVIKKLFWRVLAYVMILIVVGLLINRGFLLLFGKAIINYNRPGNTGFEFIFIAIIFFTLLIIFPVLYFWLLRGGYIESIVNMVWGEYRDDLVKGMIRHMSHGMVKQYTEGKSSMGNTLSMIDNWFDDAPFRGKLLIEYVQEKMPLLDQIKEIAGQVDEELLNDEKALNTEMMNRVKPYLQRVAIEESGGFYRIFRMAVINILILFTIYCIITFI